ncbi:hypothetical protein LRR81_04480 [Metabacillus sp. GX 13764]|uniref:hypothetical protein n=1 Tax=Metabacillus kandeliae TaxID=2900151 RepID=UPI001E31D7FC|nr:hypothetical protein [Metabacillus kandeliae]MCD7033477.1 hypothetical protein [Metabacillus kandeliae]
MESTRHQLIRELGALASTLTGAGLSATKHIWDLLPEICEEGACSVFEKLFPGQQVSVLLDSGDSIGPATFVRFNKMTGIATLSQTISTSTSQMTNIIKVDCRKTEAVTIYNV